MRQNRDNFLPCGQRIGCDLLIGTVRKRETLRRIDMKVEYFIG